MSLVNRATVRKALAEILSDALSGSGGLVSEVYSYGARSFGTHSPVIAITSAGSERGRAGGGRFFPYAVGRLSFNIHIFVLYAYRSTSGDVEWSEEDAEDRLDAIEREVVKTLMVYAINEPSATAPWNRLAFGESSVDTVVIDNVVYRYENIPVTVECGLMVGEA